MKGRAGTIVAVLVVGCLLALAASASARYLPYSFAYNAATKDVQERSSSLVDGVLSYGVDGCKRVNPGRVECKVHAEGREYIPGSLLEEGQSKYKHKLCGWTVVTHYRRGSSLVYYFDKGTTCRTWIDESAFR